MVTKSLNILDTSTDCIELSFMKTIRVCILICVMLSCLSGCRNTKIPESDKQLLSNIRTDIASSLIKEIYKDLPGFAWYWKSGKHLIGHKFSSYITIYGIQSEKDMANCIKIYKQHLTCAPTWYKIYLEFMRRKIGLNAKMVHQEVKSD